MGPTKNREKITEAELRLQADAFKVLANDVLGSRYKTLLTKTGYHYATVMRWINAELPIPPIMWMLLALLKRTPSHYWKSLFDNAQEGIRAGKPAEGEKA